MLAWIVPSAAVVAVFVLAVLPELETVTSLRRLASRTPLEAALLFSIAVLVLSVFFAYTALPIYRWLEGYTMPRALRAPLIKRQLRAWHRLQATYAHQRDAGLDWYSTLEQLAAYPSSTEEIMPTRLGNALRAMEDYGTSRFGLDSQSLWYELLAMAPNDVRRDAEDARAGVDFFISAVAHLAFLATVSAFVAIWAAVAHGSWIASAAAAVVSVALLPLTYGQAVSNVGEWRLAIRALVNTGRVPLADGLGLRLPNTFQEERELWTKYVGLVAHGPHDTYLRFLNRYRVRSPSGDGEGRSKAWTSARH